MSGAGVGGPMKLGLSLDRRRRGPAQESGCFFLFFGVRENYHHSIPVVLRCTVVLPWSQLQS